MSYSDIKYRLLKKLYWDKQVELFYHKFEETHLGYAGKNRLKTLSYIFRLNSARHNQRPLSSVPQPANADEFFDYTEPDFRYYLPAEARIPKEELLEKLSEYDVISFDIFDTAIYRKVEFPNDVFAIMASEMGHNDFIGIRKAAENYARDKKFEQAGTREIVLSEIYDVLEDRYGIDKSWQRREVELEYELSIPNPYILWVYKELLKRRKTVIFTSDMYLPKDAITRMLEKNGYTGYSHFFLSNECGLRKGDGTLQKKLMDDFPAKKIVHIGDSLTGDYEKSIKAGIDAFYNPDSRLAEREANMDNLSGSFYRAVVNTTMNNGTWNENLYYEHGFRVGGILSAGFCEHINSVAKNVNADKILFCARDCEIIWKIYNEFYKSYDNEYIAISRYAIMGITDERYLYDWANRYILRYAREAGGTRTIEAVLCEAGFPYLVDYLEKDDIERFLYARNVDEKVLRNFVFNHKDVIANQNESSRAAAKEYFASLIGDAANILIVDIGWSGTCITALKYFLEQNFSDSVKSVSGALMCTSRGRALTTSVSDETIYPYVYSPLQNMDLTRFMMPVRKTVRQNDLLHMPLEFMFTSTARSLVRYGRDESGSITFEYTGYEPDNKDEIEAMQKGMVDFVRKYTEYAAPYSDCFTISPYVAFEPLKKAVERPLYCREVYQNFTYDALSAPFSDDVTSSKFGDLFDTRPTVVADSTAEGTGRKILGITPELTYTGTPRSLLRICKVIKSLGYAPVVWSAKPGPFIAEYEACGIPVKIVPIKDLYSSRTINSLEQFEMAICNTIVTDRYAMLLSRYIPTVWYIREATNIMDFCRNNPERLYALQNSMDIYCVSDYAAQALGKYAKHKIHVVHNSVEDEVSMAKPYVNGSGDTVKFVQFGTMEYRKGYDVLLAAYLAMPEEYRQRSELFFAGGFINSGTPYCSYLFSKMQGLSNVHYLGVVKGEQNKIETLSQMDVVVVASRDESCSLVALEGAMLSKPLIVTENVGAKYMVNDNNGYIVATADVEQLKSAMMSMIDRKSELRDMGTASRKMYEEHAGMEAFTRNIKRMIDENTASPYGGQRKRHAGAIKGDYVKIIHSPKSGLEKYRKKEDVIVSLTTHPGRVETIHECIESLIRQSSRPKKILLWLSEEQFPNKEEELSEDLLSLRSSLFEIRWVKEDLKPHKKYYYTMKEYPELPVIIVDDDVAYDSNLVGSLMNSYRKHPNSISCMRANLIMFRPDGSFRPYGNWILNYRMMIDTPSYQLLPTGVGGVLYPPHSLPDIAFNKEAIIDTCLLCDDLWLKIMATYNGYNAVIPLDSCSHTEIKGTQEVALWLSNVSRNNNDVTLENILDYFGNNIGDKGKLINMIRQDRFC